MTTTDTRIDEIAPDLYRIHTPIVLPGGIGFSFNQFLLVDDASLLFHTGPRGLFASVRDAIARVMPVERLRHVGLSHFEADECGAMNNFLALAPRAEPLCGRIAAMVSVADFADRAPRALADGEDLMLGKRSVRWFDAPHVPHGWECGFLMETTTKTLLCGDLFTQSGDQTPALTTSDILEPSEAFRAPMDYFAHAPQTRATIHRLADEKPTTLACMHGSAWTGDGGALLRALAERVTAPR